MITLIYTYGLDPFATLALPESKAALDLQQAGQQGILTSFSDVLRVLYAIGCGHEALEPYGFPLKDPEFSSNYDHLLVGKSFELAFPKLGYDPDDPFNLAPNPPVDTETVLFVKGKSERPAQAPEPNYKVRFEVTPPPGAYFSGQYTLWQDHKIQGVETAFSKDQELALQNCDTAKAFFLKLGAPSTFADAYLTALGTAYANLQEGLEPLSGCLEALSEGDASHLRSLTGSSAEQETQMMTKLVSTLYSSFREMVSGLAQYGKTEGSAEAIGLLSDGLTDINTKYQLETSTLDGLARIAGFLDPKGTGVYDSGKLSAIAKAASFFAKADPEEAILHISA